MANPTGTKEVHDAMRAGKLGYIMTPRQGQLLFDGVTWCADNSCFSKGYPGDDKWLAWLDRFSYAVDRCLFATAPDVVGDAAATLKRSRPFLPMIRELGYPAALVAQDGLEELDIPWDEFDALFIGGSTDWKLGSAATALAMEAKSRGKHIHCGRVNSRRRLKFCAAVGYDSVDGTYLTFGPTVNLPKLLRWLDEINAEPTLFMT
ncbi:hypothetical protein [Mycolicibacterium phlei]|uniref:hypothetical protein n=2 Tax=Mycolicibacterium phlei TaxID=1771 RepID=UPI001E51856A|nr:hypothetical protein [Mycolicibacterium phlei]